MDMVIACYLLLVGCNTLFVFLHVFVVQVRQIFVLDERFGNILPIEHQGQVVAVAGKVGIDAACVSGFHIIFAGIDKGIAKHCRRRIQILGVMPKDKIREFLGVEQRVRNNVIKVGRIIFVCHQIVHRRFAA